MKTMRTIQIKFLQLNDLKVAYTASNFLRSLSLASNQLSQIHKIELHESLEAEIFGLSVSLSVDELPLSNNWECAVIEKEQSYQFLINGQLIAASIEKEHDLNRAVRHLPDNVQHLRIIRQPLTDLNVISKLSGLKYLDLRECVSLSDVSALSSFASLKHLNLNSCQSLTDITSVGCLTSLTSLEMQWCYSLSDIGPISSLKELEYLRLDFCEALSDIGPLRELTRLISLSLRGCISINKIDALSCLASLNTLDLGECHSLSDISAISSLASLRSLNLEGCKSLRDFCALSGLASLASLDLSNCKNLIDINALSGLASLVELDLSLCGSLTDVSSVSNLTCLTSLNLLHCASLVDISAIKNLISLTSLGLGNMPDFQKFSRTGGIVDITSISSLKLLAELRLEHCNYLSNISALANLSSLVSLEISSCSSITDLAPLSGLTRLTVFKLQHCSSVTNIDGLSGLAALRELVLYGCSALADVTALSRLTSLTMLDLKDCKSLTDISAVSSLVSLEKLVLSGCDRITSLSILHALIALKKLDISNLKRLRTTQTLQEIRPLVALEELNSPFHPAMVAELLSQASVCRHDLNRIFQCARAWLQESIDFTDGEMHQQEQFAATLGSAFSLLGNHEIIPDYEAFLNERTDFSATPWKAWLGGLKKNQGYAALVKSVERVDLAQGSAGAIGGICAALPSSEAPAAEQVWARDWLARMETAQAHQAKNLLSVCAEICLAHARLGLQDALQRWLGLFTDASDPQALDPVHVGLGQWQLQQGDTTAASEHAWNIRSPQARDPLLGKLVESCYENDQALACKALLKIDSLTLRANLASHLVAQETFAAEARNMQCLIVACGNSIVAITQLITQAHPKADPTHLRALSEKLRAPSKASPQPSDNTSDAP